jgi:hypothetical protein
MTTKVKFLGLLLLGLTMGSAYAESNGAIGSLPWQKWNEIGYEKMIKSWYQAPVDETQYVIYDHHDNVVIKATVKSGDFKEKDLVMFLNKSDFLLDFSNTLYYRLKK